MSNERALVALEQGEVPERYLRNIGTIGIAGQLLLLRAKVAVIGTGGLGGLVTELLARQGVGFIRIIDGDVFAPHNLNRQIMSTMAAVGQPKAAVAAARIAAINPDVTTEAVAEMLDEGNGPKLLEGINVAVDALDSIASRLILSTVCHQLAIPLVHAAIAGFTGQVTTLMPGGPGLEKIYKITAGTDRGIEVTLGNPAATPALAASIEAQEVVKLLTGIGEPLHNKLFYFDTELNIYETFSLDS